MSGQSKRFAIVLGFAVLLVALVAARRCGSSHKAAPSGGAATGAVHAGSATAPAKRADPRALPRASIAGLVTDDAKAPVAHARVCADAASPDLPSELMRDPRCTESDAAGHYQIGDLVAARYTVTASAPTYRPAAFHPDPDPRIADFPLAAGQAKTGVDLALRAGGVALRGTVSDLSGGPVPHALVREQHNWLVDAPPGPTVETDDQGAFTLWVAPGSTAVSASADGYAPGGEEARAPGPVEVLLTPESSVSGTVVGATDGKPVEGVRVQVAENDWGGARAVTDAEGRFRVAQLTPGRYGATARAPGGYGRSEGSVLVGLGQHVDGVTVRLYPAFTVSGRVAVAGKPEPCPNSTATLEDVKASRDVRLDPDPLDGTLRGEGVLPGTYKVIASCRGYVARDEYAPVVVRDKDVTDQVWEVDLGATLHGKVTLRSGEPVEFAHLTARWTSGGARAKGGWADARTARDGSYTLAGLKPGTHKVSGDTLRGIGPRDGEEVTVAAGATVAKDFVLDAAGTIAGVVVDPDGAPVAGATVNARGGDRYMAGGERTDDKGAFALEGVRPGDYRVTASRAWTDELKKPGTTDDAKQGEPVTVRGGETAQVRLVVESQRGSITGTVVDAAGAPVTDAFLSAARESDAAGAQRTSVQATQWTWGQRPVLTGTDGAFTIAKLSPGKYTVRAYRKGGGEAVAEHVEVGTAARLQIKPTASVAGFAHRADGGAPDDLTITLADKRTGFWRQEKSFRAGGQFRARDLPPGHFTLTAQTAGGNKNVELDLAEGEAKTGVDVTFDALVTLTGRVVDLATQRPVGGIRVITMLVDGGGGFSYNAFDDTAAVSDESGRFTVADVPVGQLQILAVPKTMTEDSYAMTRIVKTVTGAGAIDVGDLGMLKKRVKRGDPIGELGVHWAEQPPDSKPEAHEYKVSYIDPSGAAAKTELKVGDVVTAVDGVDVTGVNSSRASALLRAPPGTKISLTLARGATVVVALAPPL